jgi:hypothetical protein
MGGRCVVQGVAVVLQKFLKGLTLTSAKALEKFRPDFREIDTTDGLFVAECLTGGRRVTAQKGVCLNRGAVGVEGIHVRGKRPLLRVALVSINAVQRGVQPMALQKLLILEEKGDRSFSGVAEREGVQGILIEGKNAFPWAEGLDDFLKVPFQRALPAQGVDAVIERGGKEFLHAMDESEARVISGREKKGHVIEWQGTSSSCGWGFPERGFDGPVGRIRSGYESFFLFWVRDFSGRKRWQFGWILSEIQNDEPNAGGCFGGLGGVE